MSDNGRLEPASGNFGGAWASDYIIRYTGWPNNGASKADQKLNKVNMNEFAADMWEIIDRCGNLLLDKQEDYGPLNISNAPGGPLNGLRVRIYDKVARINNLIETGAEPNHESLRDSFVDLANYAVIALMVLDDVWPKEGGS